MLHVDQLKETLHSRNFLALVRRYFLDKLNRHLGRMRIKRNLKKKLTGRVSFWPNYDLTNGWGKDMYDTTQ